MSPQLNRLNERNLANVRSLARLVWLSTERAANLVLVTSGQDKELPEALQDRVLPDTPMVRRSLVSYLPSYEPPWMKRTNKILMKIITPQAEII